jgi:NAD(P)-dependent dehydrogenase (short-subunit alcohol dehydrogenase family)
MAFVSIVSVQVSICQFVRVVGDHPVLIPETGFVRTQMTAKIESAPDFETKMKYYGGMPRLALPQELGGAYVYLMSDTASYTTGIDIPVAGIVGAW